MLISGLQKMTLLDYPGRVACTVFTGGCNFRCPFCHNASLVIPEELRAADGGVIEGPAEIIVPVALSSLPHFVRVADGAHSARKGGAQ